MFFFIALEVQVFVQILKYTFVFLICKARCYNLYVIYIYFILYYIYILICYNTDRTVFLAL